MANWRKTRTPSVYVSHAKDCPAYNDPEARCRCDPSYLKRAEESYTAGSSKSAVSSSGG
jgi:hypothetical protein